MLKNKNLVFCFPSLMTLNGHASNNKLLSLENAYGSPPENRLIWYGIMI